MSIARNLANLAGQSLATDGELSSALSPVSASVSSVSSALSTKIDGDGITDIVALTQATYDGLTPDATTLYVVTD